MSNQKVEEMNDDIDIVPTVTTKIGVPVQFAQSEAHDTMGRITEVVMEALDALEDGKKTTLKTLQALVTEKTGLKNSNIGPVISMIVKAHSGVSMELGRYGGIYKGIRERAAKEPDTKTRCLHCKQVIRQKTGPRKKKPAVDAATQPLAAATTQPITDEDFEDDEIDDDDNDHDSEQDDDQGEDTVN